MDQCRSRLKLSENFERHWSIPFPGEIHMDQFRVPQKEVGKRSSITFFVFGTLSVTFCSLFLMLLSLFSSLFCQTPFARLLLRQGDQSLVHTFSWENSYGPMVLKVLLKFPATLVLVHGWLFPVRVRLTPEQPASQPDKNCLHVLPQTEKKDELLLVSPLVVPGSTFHFKTFMSHEGETHPQKNTHPNQSTVCANNFGTICTNCPPSSL